MTALRMSSPQCLPGSRHPEVENSDVHDADPGQASANACVCVLVFNKKFKTLKKLIKKNL